VIEGRFLINGELKSTAVGIEDGRIATIGNLVRGGDERIDLGDRIVLPGFMDPHVHFRDPGMTGKEDFGTGTMSALNAGVTCILDMPNTKPPVTGIKTLESKKRAVSSKAYVDYGLFAAITKNLDVAAVADRVAGFKLFMGSTTGRILMNDDALIERAMAAIAPTGKRISVHAEDDNLIRRDGERNDRDHMRNRPPEAEHSAIRRLGRYRGMPLNICHVTNAESLALASSFGFATEVTPHHLLLDSSGEDGALLKVNPPLRDRSTREKLFAAFIRGKATMIGTDHAPHTLTDKSSDYDRAPSGVPGVETAVPMFMAMVKKGEMNLGELVRMGSTNPAKAFSVRKGKIAKGYDADFAVFDPRKMAPIDANVLHSKAGYTPYEGKDAIMADTVIVRGNVQMRGGEFCGSRCGEDLFD
jgi:dihydroorotase